VCRLRLQFAIPVMALLASGAMVDIATPAGNKPALDPHSNSSSYFPDVSTYTAALELWNTFPPLQSPMLLSSLASEDPDAPVDAVSPDMDK
jgi:hypothetical protein